MRYLGEIVEEAEYVVGGESSLCRVPEHDVSEAGSNVVEKIFNLRNRRTRLTHHLTWQRSTHTSWGLNSCILLEI